MDDGTIVTRPEVRDLTLDQFRAFAAAVSELHAAGGTGNHYDQFVAVHYDNVPQAHGVPAFFPWHREFLRRFEVALQSIDPTVVLPYWDWTIDAADPAASVILTSDYFGGNGREEDQAVVDGPFANWTAAIPQTHPLRRQFDDGSRITPFYSAQNIEAILRKFTNSYDGFLRQIESGPQSTVHANIGGNNGDMTFMYSVNDPLFWVHHAFIDLLWFEWQQRYPNLAHAYDGNTLDGDPVSPSDVMVPFGIPVSQVMDTTAPGYRYLYKRWSGALPTS
ncbi:tyrosinase family protein [Streptacidiphilus sp. EB129]|uniref:tyrosinase family protein n=1 Tax=Streptacidiphilus sp. EB129 TaxID=3156262 RepID=UPI00351602EB